ncbi:MAG TPA: hypothetical protein VL088_15800 [Pedobacter sp.]|nr:hypothetical protein [Pedobacter sp.]
METTTTERKTNEETFLHLIYDFFDCRTLPAHMIFLDYWLEKALINKQHKKYLNAKDITFFSTKFLALLGFCHKIHTKETKNSIYFEESIKIPDGYILKEQQLLLLYPNYLRTREICNPLLAFQSIFKNCTLDFYTTSINIWANEIIAEKSKRHILQTYFSLKRMMEACWLIHERSVSKNSYQYILNAVNPTHDFALSCPLLLTDEYLGNPYLMVEEFFSFASIDEYKEDLTKWFKMALNNQESYENANDLLFIHNQMLQLIHAGYLIGILRLTYLPKTNYTTQHETFGHWLIARMETISTANGISYGNPVQLLSPHFKENPIDYCIEKLTIDHIIKIRYGLKEWLEAALSKNSNITNLDHIYIFDQFEELQKIMEALFLLIIQPTRANSNIN